MYMCVYISFSELRDASKVQTENLSKQLTQQLKDSDGHNKILQANVKRLERYTSIDQLMIFICTCMYSELEEMVHVHQKETRSCQGQLEVTQASNQQLQIKVCLRLILLHTCIW